MTGTLTVDSIVSARDDLLSTDLSPDEIVMINVDRGTYYGMEEVAKAIWELLAKPRKVASLCDDLQSRFDVDRETCERDTLAFLRELQKEELLHVHPAGPTP